jgi:hypothetical protein
MLSWCSYPWGADLISLMANRLTIVGVCAWGVSFCGARFLGREDGSLVPRWFWLPPP